jgi:hypothetical protein
LELSWQKDHSSVTAALRTAFILLALGGSAFTQHLDFGFDFGVKGGVPFTDLLENTGTINVSNATVRRSNDYLVGPVIELRIPFGFAFEVDGIYRNAEYRVTTNDIVTRLNANAWEIPYLAKFRFPIPLLKPFISGGGAYRTFTSLPNNVVTPTHNGVVLAGGLELRISKLRISGELRWLHWNKPPNNTNSVRLGQDQGEVLFGFVF